MFDCVLLTAFDSEFDFLKNVCGRVGIRMHHANTLEQADFLPPGNARRPSPARCAWPTRLPRGHFRLGAPLITDWRFIFPCRASASDT